MGVYRWWWKRIRLPSLLHNSAFLLIFLVKLHAILMNFPDQSNAWWKLSVELHQQWIWPSEGQIKPAMSKPTKSCFHTLACVSSLVKYHYRNKHFWAASFSWGGPWAAGCHVWGVTVSFSLASSGSSPCCSCDSLRVPRPPAEWNWVVHKQSKCCTGRLKGRLC